jgi:SAM-dependent methyltransferase
VLTDDQRSRTLARYEEHRRAWQSNDALRALYSTWYGRVAARLPDPRLGPFIEIGSGPGFARSFIPSLQLSDVVWAPWHDHEISADRLPFAAGTVGALVLFDVLHHLAAPGAFFEEASRVLVAGGRVVMCEPYLSLLSFPVYRWLHQEPVILGVDPLGATPAAGGTAAGSTASGVTPPLVTAAPVTSKDPFDSNQAIPTLIFGRKRGRAAFAAKFPSLKMGPIERFAGLSYPASGGFGRALRLPMGVWRAIHAIEPRIPNWVYHLIGFRMLVVLEKRES